MASKLHIKIGAVEFDYEGDLGFTEESIKDLFSHLQTAAEHQPPASSKGGGSEKPSGQGDEQAPQQPGTINLHTNTIAAKLGSKSGSDLIIAAASNLQLVQGKETFSRTELLDTMKTATSYFNVNMSANLTKYLKALTTGPSHRLTLVAQNTYSLTAEERKNLEAKLLA